MDDNIIIDLPDQEVLEVVSDSSEVIDYTSYLSLIDSHLVQVDESIQNLKTVSTLLLVVCGIMLVFRGVLSK